MKETKKFAQVLIGTGLIALAISLLITAHQGYDTISTFLLGILNFVDVPFWIASLCFNIVVLLIVAVFDRAELGIGSLDRYFRCTDLIWDRRWYLRFFQQRISGVRSLDCLNLQTKQIDAKNDPYRLGCSHGLDWFCVRRQCGVRYSLVYRLYWPNL